MDMHGVQLRQKTTIQREKVLPLAGRTSKLLFIVYLVITAIILMGKKYESEFIRSRPQIYI